VARLAVILTPRARASALVGLESVDGQPLLRARVSAPPVDGRANEALEQMLAVALDLPASAVRVVAGRTSRRKQVEVSGLSLEEVLARIERFIAS
jgi:uncharacterized protein YggU (UPF0235/DUF167 family)